EDGLRPGVPKLDRSELLRSDAGVWQIDASPDLDERGWNFVDACFDPTGDGWFVGYERVEPHVFRALAVRYTNGDWHRAALPAIAARNSGLRDVVCLPGNRAVALATSSTDRDRSGPPVLLRYDSDRWQQIELPESFQRAEIGALAALSDSDVWLGVSN